jgi:hypothetical protein
LSDDGDKEEEEEDEEDVEGEKEQHWPENKLIIDVKANISILQKNKLFVTSCIHAS